MLEPRRARLAVTALITTYTLYESGGKRVLQLDGVVGPGRHGQPDARQKVIFEG